MSRQDDYNEAWEAGYTAALKQSLTAFHERKDTPLHDGKNEPAIEFQAMAQGRTDYTLPVIRINDMLTICTPDAAVYVTREQACKFWGLVDAREDSAQQQQLSQRSLVLQRLERLLGYWQNGSDTPVKISQDDATRDFILTVGYDSAHSRKPRTYYGRSLEAAIGAAIDAGEGEE